MIIDIDITLEALKKKIKGVDSFHTFWPPLGSAL